jgi:hypothetical protein
MKHFDQLGTFDPLPLQKALKQTEHLFGQIDWREKYPGSSHPNTQTIYLRMPVTVNPDTLLNSVSVEDCLKVPEFDKVIDFIGHSTVEEIARVMVVRLYPQGTIGKHRDEGFYAEMTNRFHAVIETNDQAWLQVGNEKLHMPEGTIWRFNKHEIHFGANDGDTPRTHLIVDTFR